ncbi:hypothetical protein EV673_2830 [Limnobacter thiooxidans]|uniref:Uncharacterized protein n=1 Tax=Limnobacter thiooxidans TaxID=131080 RepID=A0AA86IZQ7_9BURK|nr:hypothetical protein EV673_2830 [Limnobacter thiooxidans]BET25103.1 hypothetical protein RGQ30_06040 [Limnobacter thiooxidans]
MNKRALVYLGLASATLAGAYLYVPSTVELPVQIPAGEENAAQALDSLSLVDGALTTGSYNTTVQKGQRIQFLVYSNETDSLIVEGLDARVPLPGNETTLVSIKASEPGTHTILLDLAGTSIGTIEVLNK